ncbi:alkaline phosphatase PhoX [Aquabacterium sp. A3]|uniref:alkaline phosphatase PhoX n=1 Tax=Aquabacterium sp. A3 TaxID=3132829 RepID=UPI00311A8402
MKQTRIAMAAMAAMAVAASASAATEFDNFTPLLSSQTSPLPESAPVLLSSPLFTQEVIANRSNQNTLVPGSNSGNWDMITANESGANAGRYLFMPFETGSAGVQRVDLWDTNYNTRTTTIVAPGTSSFVSGDASRWTPWGSYLTAEESWGATSTKGRLFEVTNATTAVANGGDLIHRSIVPRVSHEGLAFDSSNSLYFIDEFNGGSLYKYVAANPNASTGNEYFTAGQTFVAKVDGGNNANATGALTWEAITDATGAPLSTSVIGVQGDIDGRLSANAVGGTDYMRPEDLEVIVNAAGQEVLYMATTTTHEIYAVNLSTNEVSLFANRDTLDLGNGQAVGAELTNPDNLAVDAEGNLYIIEDQPGADRDDIWFARDLNHDGDLNDEGEGLQRWASNGIPGSEFTGMYFDKFNPNVTYVNIQHPNSGNDLLVKISAVPAVPEPSTYGLALAGLIVAGVMARRRRA